MFIFRKITFLPPPSCETYFPLKRLKVSFLDVANNTVSWFKKNIHEIIPPILGANLPGAAAPPPTAASPAPAAAPPTASSDRWAALANFRAKIKKLFSHFHGYI